MLPRAAVAPAALVSALHPSGVADLHRDADERAVEREVFDRLLHERAVGDQDSRDSGSNSWGNHGRHAPVRGRLLGRPKK